MSGAFLGRRTGAGLCALIVASGCSPYGPVTSEVRVRDPSRVSLRSLDDPRRVLLPEGRQPARTTVGEGRLYRASGASTAYRADALREPDGGIALEVEVKAPIVGGERRELLTASGRIGPLQQPGSTVVSPDAPPSPELSFPVHGSLEAARHGYRWTPDRVRAQVTFGGRLSTPWENVIEATEIQRVQDRRDTVLFSTLGAALLGVPGGILVGLGPRDSVSAVRYSLTSLGGAVLGASVALAIHAVVAGVAPDRVRVLRRPGDHAATVP